MPHLAGFCFGGRKNCGGGVVVVVVMVVVVVVVIEIVRDETR